MPILNLFNERPQTDDDITGARANFYLQSVY